MMKKLVLPEEKLNALAQEISDKLLQSHYFSQGVIRGEALKDFAEHNQINKFLLFQVYQVWSMQISKLKHPYFEFDHPNIQESLQLLRNQLSQHISISQQDFKPMLKRAVYNNLKLLLDPKETFTSFFFANRDKTSLDLYERYTPFFSDFDFIVNSIQHYHKKNQMDTVEKDIFFLKMKKVIAIFDKKSEKGFEAYRREIIERLTNRNLDDLLREVEEEEKARQAQQEEEIRRQAEAAKQQQAETARQKEEAAKKAAEEAAKKEEEARKLRLQEEANRKSFFDTLTETNTYFDIEDSDETTVEPLVDQEEEVPVGEAETITEVAEATAIVIEEVADEEELAPIEEEAQAVNDESVEEISEEEAESQVEAAEEVAEEPVQAEEAQEEKEENTVDTIADRFAAFAKEHSETTIMDRLAKAEAEEEKAVDHEEHPQTIAERLASQEEEKTETTTSFLDRFLNNKKDEKLSTPPPSFTEHAAKTVVEQLEDEKSSTIVDKLQEVGQQVVHEKLNGDKKIKLNEIPIHKQYQYVQKVFDGNNVRFRIIVDKVNNAKGKNEVEEILEKFVLSKDDIDQNDGVVKEFVELLRNRF